MTANYPKKVVNINSEQNKENTSLDDNSIISELAKMSRLEYAKVRKEEAKEIGIPVGTLDKLVAEVRKENNKTYIEFPEITPLDKSVDFKKLLPEIISTIQTYVICEYEIALVAALWSVLTWFVGVLKFFPILLITSATKESGKSTLQEVLFELCFRPYLSSGASVASMFRIMDEHRPTFFSDEIDNYVDEYYAGLLNCGFSLKNGKYTRCEGDSNEPRTFYVAGFRCLCGIGKLLKDTTLSRCIILEMKRKTANEHVERLSRTPEGTFKELQRKIARFAEDNKDHIKEAYPTIEKLNNRALDVWEKLIALADLAGDDFGKKAREAAIKLSASNDAVSTSVDLLGDIREIFETFKTDKIFTETLIVQLCKDPEKKWSTYDFKNHEKELKPRQLANLLSGYGIKSKDVRIGEVKKGYELDQFTDAFSRYLYPLPPEKSATGQQNDIEQRQ